MSRRRIGPAAVLAMLAFAIAVYPSLPERIATHWNWKGEVDGYTAKWPGAFLLPAIALGVWLLLQGLLSGGLAGAHRSRARPAGLLLRRVAERARPWSRLTPSR